MIKKFNDCARYCHKRKTQKEIDFLVESILDLENVPAMDKITPYL
jgi:hypothetical protein